jgi:hypothetical protein
MSEMSPSVLNSESELATGGKPFNLDDMQPFFQFKEHSFLHLFNPIQKEVKFIFKLAKNDWNRGYLTTILAGIIAFLLGSISGEVFDGGNARLSGLQGISEVGGANYFQLILSMLLWLWFLYNAWILFPAMRTHTISLILMWNFVMGAMIFFHTENSNFPFDFKLSEMMQGTLLILIVAFFLYFFWKAVIETRDLHIELNHVHEDVRVMEQEMREHSLRGWSALFFIWVFFVLIGSWSGTHFIAERGTNSILFFGLHLVFGGITVPLLMTILWYPQRMLGTTTTIQTKAARIAERELLLENGELIGEELVQGSTHHSKKAACVECGAESALVRLDDGSIAHPCSTQSCKTPVPIGTKCKKCKQQMPSRINCESCGMNSPAIDYFPNLEVW